MRRRVAITGMAGISPIGNDWATVREHLQSYRNAVVKMEDWSEYEGLNTQLGAPAADFKLPEHYTTKATRSMGRVALMATRGTELALGDAGLLDDPLVKSGKLGIAYGSCAGTPSAMCDFAKMVDEKSTRGICATTYIKSMGHTAPVNIGIFFGITGRIIPTASACTSGSQAIGYAYEAIRFGRQDLMVAGGAEELCPTMTAVFDTLYATSTRNDAPSATPRPYDRDRDGLVIGEAGVTLVLEELEQARARGARILAESFGFPSNSDGSRVTQPSQATMAAALRGALDDAELPPSEIGFVSGHGT